LSPITDESLVINYVNRLVWRMRRGVLWVILGASGVSTLFSQTILYWDTNGATAGAGTGAGLWSGTNWSTSSAGTAATQAWTSGATAVFSAGTNLAGATYTVNAAASLPTVGGITVDEGAVTVDLSSPGGKISFNGSAPVVTVADGTSLEFGNRSAFQYTLDPGTGSLTFNVGSIGVNTSYVWVNAEITGTGSVVKNGGGDLHFYADKNSYTGTTTVNQGTLILDVLEGNKSFNGNIVVGDGTNTAKAEIGTTASAANDVIAHNVVATVNANGVLETHLYNETVAGLILNGGTVGNLARVDSDGVGATSPNPGTGLTTLTVNGNITASGNSQISGVGSKLDLAGSTSTISVTNSGDILTIGSVVQNGGVQKNGNGTLILSAANTFAGGTTINAGTLQNGATNALLSTSAVTLNNSGIWSLNNFSQTIGSIGSTSATTGIALGSATLTAGDATNTTFAGVVSGTGSFVKTGAGTTIFSGTNTYAGTTTLNGGTLSVATLANGGTGSGIGSASNAAANLVLNGGTLQYTGTGTASTDRLLTIGTAGGTLDASGTGAVNFTNAGALALTSAGTARSFALAGSNTGANTLAAVIGNSGAGVTSVTKSGAGTWALTGTNSYTGATTINGGILVVSSLANGGSNSGIGASTNAATNLSINGGTLQYTGAGASTDRLLTIGASGGTIDSSGSGALIFTNAGALIQSGTGIARTLTLAGSNVGTNTMASVITDAGAGATGFTKNGAGIWIVAGTNTYTGATTINSGTLRLGTGAGVGTTTDLTVASGATFDVNGKNASIGSLSGLGGVILGSANTLTVGNATDKTYGGSISGAGNVTKTGTSTLTLTGSSTSFTGTLNLNQGTVQLGASNILSSALSFGGGTLSTNGFNATLSSASLVANSILDFNSTNGILNFTTGTRTGGTLTINNWAGSTSGGGASQLLIPGTITGLLLANINFSGYGAGAQLIGSEIVPITGAAFTWTKDAAGTQNWSNAGGIFNWSPTTGNPNAIDQVANFTTLSQARTVTLDLNRTVGYINLSSSSNYTISPSAAQVITMDVTTGNAQINVSSSGSHTIAAGLSLNQSLVVNQNSTGTLTLSAANAITGLNKNVTFNGSGNTVVSGVIATGTGLLTKNNAGTLTLSGVNTYTGGTTINGGTLRMGIGGAVPNGAVSVTGTGVGATSTLDLNNFNATVSSLTFGGTTASSGSAVTTGTGTLTLGGNVTYAAANNPLGSTLSGNLSLGAADRTFTIGHSTTAGTDLTVSAVVSGTAGIIKTGAGTLLLSGANTYSGQTQIQAGTLAVNTLANLSASSGLGMPTTAANGTIKIGSGATGATLSYLGPTASVTNRVVDLSGTTGGATLDSSGAGAVTFSSALTASGAGSKTLTLAGTSTGANTISGAIVNNSGTNITSLVKSGVGTWVLSGANTYTGSTALNGGILSINADNNLGVGGALSFSGGTLQTTGSFTTARGANLNAAGGTIDIASGSLTDSGVISGTGSLTKSSAGTLILSGANTYTGATTITGGILQANSNAALGSLTSGAVTISAGGTLDIGGNPTANNANFGAKQFNIAGTGAGGNGAITNSSVNSQTSAFQQIALTADAMIGGTGRFDLNGGTPTLDLAGFTLTKTGTNQVSVVGGTITGGNIIVNQGTLSLQAGTNAVAGSGTFTFNAGTTADFSSTSGTITRAMTFNGASITESGVSTLGSAITMGGNNTINVGGTSLTLTGNIGETGGARSLTKSGTGTLVLSGSDSYTGTTAITSGVLKMGSVTGLGSGTAVSVSSGATLDLNNNSTTIASIAGAGSITLGSATLTAGSDNSTTALSGVISGTGDLMKTGSGILTLSGTNTFTGNTTVSGGSISVSADANLGASPPAATINAITLNGGALQTTATFSLGTNRGITLGAGGGTLDTTGTLTYGGSLTGTGGLTKIGSGTLVLSGASNYSGGTTLSAGTLRAVTNASVLGTGNLAVAGGSTLQLAADTATNFGRNTSITGSGVAAITVDRVTAGAGITQTMGTLALGAQTLKVTAGPNITTNTAYGLTFGATSLSAGAGFDVSNNGTGIGTLTLGAVTGAIDITKQGSGTLAFTSSLGVTNLTLAGGTLAFGGSTLTVQTFHITANSILDFGNATASTLRTTNFIIDSGVQLTITNWVDLSDAFFATNWWTDNTQVTLVGRNTRGVAPENQITFSSPTVYSPNATAWQSYDNQITPVPEARTYGLIFLGLVGGFVWWRGRVTGRLRKPSLESGSSM
jgi:fibronectin-binding autotransporter adhesin